MLETFSDRLNHAFEQLPPQKRVKTKLAKHCGVRAPSVQGWFTGKANMVSPPERLHRLCEYLGVTPAWLALGEGAHLVPSGRSQLEAAKMHTKTVSGSLTSTLDVAGLSPLQIAAASALIDALAAGAYNERQCIDLCSEFIHAKETAQEKLDDETKGEGHE